MPPSAIRLLLVDDQDLIREAIRIFLEREPTVDVVGTASNGAQAVDEAKTLVPDVVLMDVRMPGLSGAEATSQIKRSSALRRTKILILTSYEDGPSVQTCLRAGADGFIGKGVAPEQLIAAIHAVHRGESPLSPRAARNVLSHMADATPDLAPDQRSAMLTAREIEIVVLAARGSSNHAIGRELHIAPTTVKTHVTNAMRKLRVHDRASLVALAYRIGLVK